jgi:hypothetical protein
MGLQGRCTVCTVCTARGGIEMSETVSFSSSVKIGPRCNFMLE